MTNASVDQRRRVLRALRSKAPIAPEDRALAEQVARMPGSYERSPARKALAAATWLFWVVMLALAIFGTGSSDGRRVAGIGAGFFLALLVAGAALRASWRRHLRTPAARK